MKTHTVISIGGLERKFASFKNNNLKRLHCYELFGIDYPELLQELEEMKAKGFTVIPGENCNHLPDGRCPGHPNS